MKCVHCVTIRVLSGCSSSPTCAIRSSSAASTCWAWRWLCTARTGNGEDSTRTRHSLFLVSRSGQREAQGPNGRRFWTFLPAISKDALKKISREVRRWRIHRWIGLTFAELARSINRVVAGWMHYYGRFYRSALHPLLMRINSYLVRWIRNMYKRLRAIKKALRAMHEAARRHPGMFRHWKWTTATSLT
jgi:hypothetical protein